MELTQALDFLAELKEALRKNKIDKIYHGDGTIEHPNSLIAELESAIEQELALRERAALSRWGAAGLTKFS